MKLAIFDLDGTLIDTKEINFCAYRKALKEYELDIEYDFFRRFCNGRNYKEFLPKLIAETHKELVDEVHRKKVGYYSEFLDEGKLNTALVDIIRAIKPDCKIAIVTTASETNTHEALEFYGIKDLFDLIITKEMVAKCKPDPEGFVKAMEHFDIEPKDTVIFEDSDVGLEAAQRSGANYYRVYGFN